MSAIDALAGGALAGLCMMLAFVAITPVMVFTLARNPSPLFERYFGRANPTTLMLGIVVIAYPVWASWGAAMGLVFRAMESAAPAGGLGTPNLAFTLFMVATAVIFVTPLAVLLRRVALGFGLLAAAYSVFFGWLLPIVVQAAGR